MSTTDIKEVVKERYGQAALRVRTGGSSCWVASAATNCADPMTSNLYDPSQTTQIPEEALLASLGCGNPTALAQLQPGEVVLDLGSGGGIDVLLSARRVGPARTPDALRDCPSARDAAPRSDRHDSTQHDGRCNAGRCGLMG